MVYKGWMLVLNKSPQFRFLKLLHQHHLHQPISALKASWVSLILDSSVCYSSKELCKKSKRGYRFMFFQLTHTNI